jgi:methyl-accepting chemotaxis protein
LNVCSPSNFAANEEPSISFNDILSVIRNGQAEVRLQIEQSQEEIRNGHRQFEDFQEKIRSCQAEICQRLEQRFETVVQSMRGEIGEVTTRVDEVSEHVNVVANQVDRVVGHVNNVNGRFDNVVNRLQRLERSQNVGSPSGDSTEVAARDVGRTRSGRPRESSAVNHRRYGY